MKPISLAFLASSATVVAAAAFAQTQAPGTAPIDPAAARRQSGTVGPPLDAASTASTAPVPAAPATPPASAATVEPAPGAAPAPAADERPQRPSRRASGRVTDPGEHSGALPIRPDRN